MVLAVGKIEEMTGLEKKDLLVNGARKADENRYEATMALALLERSGEWKDLGYSSVHQLAAETTQLKPRDIRDMLWMGRTLLKVPELAEAYEKDVLPFSKVRALIPVVTRENVGKWIALALRVNTAQLEHEVGGKRDPIFGLGMVPMMPVPLGHWRFFQEMAERARARTGDDSLTDADCLWEMLSELKSSWDGGPAVAPIPTSRHIPARVRREVLQRANYRCELCGNVLSIEAHHWVLFSKGGTHTKECLGAVCSRCHETLHASGKGIPRIPRTGDGPSAKVVAAGEDPPSALERETPAA